MLHDFQKNKPAGKGSYLALLFRKKKHIHRLGRRMCFSVSKNLVYFTAIVGAAIGRQKTADFMLSKTGVISSYQEDIQHF